MDKEKLERERVVPVIEQELVAGKQVTKTGSVRVQIHVEPRTEHVSMPLLQEAVDVRRVAVGRVVESRPDTRTEGDTTIIPVVEEELVVSKRLILKEEIYLTKRMSRVEGAQDVTLENERAEVLRMDSSGRVTGSGDPDKSRRRLQIRRPSE